MSRAAAGASAGETSRAPIGIVDRLAAAAAACPAVAALAHGPVATHLPGRVVSGVAVRDGTIEVAIVARYGVSLPEAAAQVRAAVRSLARKHRVDVTVEDIEPPAGLGVRPAGATAWKG